MTTLTMPLSMPLNILSFLDRLKETGMSDTQVKAQAEVLHTVIQACEEGGRKVSESTARETVNSMRAELRNELATKGDIADVRSALREESIAVRADIRETELRLEAKIEASKHEMIKWFVGISIAQVGVIVGILAAFYAIIR